MEFRAKGYRLHASSAVAHDMNSLTLSAVVKHNNCTNSYAALYMAS